MTSQHQIVRLPLAYEYAQLLSICLVKHSLEFYAASVMNTRPLTNKFKKTLISNINKHHQKTLGSY